MASKKIEKIRVKRKARVRAKIFGTEAKPRLSVFRSALHIYVQAIADDAQRMIAEASTLSQELKGSLGKLNKVDRAKEVGRLVSKRLQAMGISQVVFDRGSFLYHGRVRALAEAVRETGMKF